MKESPWYYDAPKGDPDSLYLAAEIIRISVDPHLVTQVKALLADFKQQLQNTRATLPRSVRRSAGGPANYLATTSPQLIDCPLLARSLFWSLIIAGEVPDKAFESIKRKTQIICNVILSRAFGPELRKYFAPDNGRFTLNADRLRRSISALSKFYAN
jgi:hypothetical protein